MSTFILALWEDETFLVVPKPQDLMNNYPFFTLLLVD